jgi:hypothetical protein
MRTHFHTAIVLAAMGLATTDINSGVASLCL